MLPNMEGIEMLAKTEAVAAYNAAPNDEIIAQALAILAARMRAPGVSLSSPSTVRDWLRLRLAEMGHEVFMVLFLDAQNRLIDAEELFRGTLTQISVYPREVLKRALAHNAHALILAHNHPSGSAEPSHADRHLTLQLKAALDLVDVKVLDHFVVAGAFITSFDERGYI
jgi:DNA repair protein RadC